MFFLGIGIGFIFAVIVMAHLLKKNPLNRKGFLYILFLCSIVSVVVLETGWVMAEFARQPWIIYNVMTVVQAGNYSPNILTVSMAIFAFYIMIIPFSLMIMKRILKNQNL